MKANDADLFKDTMEVEIASFKEENMFKLIPLTDKPKDKILIPFAWSFKRKRNALGELIKHKAHLCINSAKQVFGVDY